MRGSITQLALHRCKKGILDRLKSLRIHLTGRLMMVLLAKIPGGLFVEYLALSKCVPISQRLGWHGINHQRPSYESPHVVPIGRTPLPARFCSQIYHHPSRRVDVTIRRTGDLISVKTSTLRQDTKIYTSNDRRRGKSLGSNEVSFSMTARRYAQGLTLKQPQ